MTPGEAQREPAMNTFINNCTDYDPRYSPQSYIDLTLQHIDRYDYWEGESPLSVGSYQTILSMCTENGKSHFRKQYGDEIVDE